VLKSTFEKIRQWVIANQDEIILFVAVVLISLLSFALGYITAKIGGKEPLRFEEPISTNYDLGKKATVVGILPKSISAEMN